MKASSTMEILNHLKKSKKMLEYGKTFHYSGSTVLIQWKCCSTKSSLFDSVDSLSIPMISSHKIKLIRITWKQKSLRLSKASLSKKSNAGHVTMPDIGSHFRAIVTKAAWNQGPKLNPLSYRHLIFKRNVKNMHWRIVVSLTNGGQKKKTTEYLYVKE